MSAPPDLVALWPVYGVRVRTARLELRLPDETELAHQARLAGRGVHPPDERPFLTPWTGGSADEVARDVLRGHWSDLATSTPTDWRVGLAVLRDGEPLGGITLRARDFGVVREVTTSSWLGVEHQGHGVGTEARVGALALAFDHLGAVAARSEVFGDNHASQAVSRRLGYQHDGISRDARGDEVLVSDRLRLSRDRWQEVRRAVGADAVRVDGVDAARADLGA